MPSSITWACNPSGGTKVMGCRAVSDGWAWGLVSGTPCPSTELDHVSQSKEWACWIPKWGGLREAGFTSNEQLPLCAVEG
ncbi:hypothetical protein RND71_022531 [Anisodus tanguticus]|uniref:Uncharacterized protein n=1 Tax=Anisodus tanguticus TaxID=243964 RepID=A0AAE1VAU3_9SOLA|nr:hypothetical protein RND71_022531 [Anisodus tanguticus]